MVDATTLGCAMLTVDDVAHRLNVGKSFVRQLIKARELDADPFGKIHEEDLRAFIDSCRETTSVYFVQMEHSRHVKIGIALDVQRRLDGIRTGNPEPLAVLCTALMSAKRAKKLEREIHKALADYRLAGEWFKSGEWIERLKAGIKPGRHFSEVDLRRILL